MRTADEYGTPYRLLEFADADCRVLQDAAAGEGPKKYGPGHRSTARQRFPGFPLGPSRPRQDIPDDGNMARVKAMRAGQRKNGTAILSPIGPPQLIKRRDYELLT